MKSKIAKLMAVLMMSTFSVTVLVTSTKLSLNSASDESTPTFVWSFGTGGDILDVKSVPDLNGDGHPDVLVGSADNNCYALNGRNGTKIWNKLTGGDVTSVDFVSDITDDGIPEITCGSSDTYVYLLNGSTGLQIWREPANYSPPIYRVQGIPDVTGDDLPDVVAGGIIGMQERFECKNGVNGLQYGIYGYSTGSHTARNDFAAIADCSGSGEPGLVYTYDSYGTFYMSICNLVTKSILFTRSDLPVHDSWVLNWKIPDVTGDGYDDILDIRNDVGASNGAQVRVISGPSIETVWSFEKPAVASDERAWDANYISDITGDGRIEIAIGWKDKVFMCSGINGDEIWNATLSGANPDYSRAHRITDGRDISGDGVGDIIVGVQNGDVHFLNGLDGTSIQEPYRIGGSVLSIAYMDDVSGDSIPEVVVGGADNFVYCLAPQEEPPQFQSITWTPTCPHPLVYSSTPREGEPVDIETIVTDASGIDAVGLSYRIDGGVWWNTSLTYNATTSRWAVTIPGQLGNAEVEFFLQAFDNNENRNTSSPYTYTVKALVAGDINGDGVVDVYDLRLLGEDYGESSP